MKYELQKIDSYWSAAMHIINSRFADEGRVWRHISADKATIQFRRMLKDGTFSSGELSLLRIAASLFNFDCKINLAKELSSLDETCFQIAIKAIAIKWSGRVQ